MAAAKERLEQQLQIARENNASREQIAQLMTQGRKEMAQLAASLRNEPAPSLSTITDPNDPSQQIVVDARRYDPKTGAGVIGVSGKLGDKAKATLKREQQFEGIGDTIQKAEDILNGVIRDEKTGAVTQGTLPTASLMGKGLDIAAGVFGRSPDGADEAARLKVLGGSLVTKVPRFEGPQSDKDTALYREMAGQVGDDSIPLSKRRAALSEVKRLYGKFEEQKSNKGTSNSSVDM